MIDYSRIASAIDFYTNRGFQRIETPWLVSKDIADLTKPLDASTYIVQKDTDRKQKAFVASGEQSFLYLINKGHLPANGRYQTVTPCLRDDMWDVTHMKNFIKLELIEYTVYDTKQYPLNFNSVNCVTRMVDQAMDFFSTVVGINNLKVVNTSTKDAVSFDIELDGVEIGSYGYRNSVFCEWIYGTGIAEPRFSRIVNSVKRKK